MSMGRSRAEIMETLTAERRAEIDARAAELVGEVEGLKALWSPSAARSGTPRGLGPNSRRF